jgi:hypothetical protein
MMLESILAMILGVVKKAKGTLLSIDVKSSLLPSRLALPAGCNQSNSNKLEGKKGLCSTD